MSAATTRARAGAAATALVGILVVQVPLANAAALDGVELGVRADVRVGSGKPVNDVLGYALVASYPLPVSGWRSGIAIDVSPEFDIEYPLTFLDLEGPDEDSVGNSTMVTAFAERRYGSGLGLQPFWTVGIGINSIDVDPFAGTLDDGTAFDVRIDAGTEVALEGTAGVRYAFTRHFSILASALLQHRFADWSVEELESGRTDTVDDYTLSGAYFGASYRF